MALIPITRRLAINTDDLTETFVRSSGPGGQHVNKVATAVQLRFDTTSPRSLTPEVRARLAVIAAHHISHDGVLVINAQRHRSQNRNRQDAFQRLQALVMKAVRPPKARRPTRPTKASIERRLHAKKLHSRTKQLRSQPPRASE
jgi:ribosome-associated protein